MNGLQLITDMGRIIVMHFLKSSRSKNNIWFRETQRRTETYWDAGNRSMWSQNSLLSIVVRLLMASVGHPIRELVFRLMLFNWLLWQWWSTGCHGDEMEIWGTSFFRGGGFSKPCLSLKLDLLYSTFKGGTVSNSVHTCRIYVVFSYS